MTVSESNEAHGLPQEVDESTPLNERGDGKINYANKPWLTVTSILVWVTISGLNCYLVIAFLTGAEVHF